MDAKRLNPILYVSNIVESFVWFEKFGWKKAWDWGEPPRFGAVAQGLEVMWPPTSHPWGAREMHVRHPGGHVFRVSREIGGG